MRNYSFSIKPDDTKDKSLLDQVKQHCKDSGKTFSFVIITALRNYMRDLTNGKV